MMITNDQGQVALKYKKQIPKYIELRNGHAYAFSVKRNVSVSWVEADDVATIFNIKEGCCGNKSHQAFTYANERDMGLWTGEIT